MAGVNVYRDARSLPGGDNNNAAPADAGLFCDVLTYDAAAEYASYNSTTTGLGDGEIAVLATYADGTIFTDMRLFVETIDATMSVDIGWGTNQAAGDDWTSAIVDGSLEALAIEGATTGDLDGFFDGALLTATGYVSGFSTTHYCDGRTAITVEAVGALDTAKFHLVVRGYRPVEPA